jgi:hypothetical protein
MFNENEHGECKMARNFDTTPKVCQRIDFVAKDGSFRGRVSGPIATPPQLRICARYRRHPSMSRAVAVGRDFAVSANDATNHECVRA